MIFLNTSNASITDAVRIVTAIFTGLVDLTIFNARIDIIVTRFLVSFDLQDQCSLNY